jgi:predicted small integral membrane protein
MPEPILLLAHSACVAMIAAWLTLGLRDNLLHPSLIRALIAEVMEISRMKAAYPAQFAQLSHRAVHDPRLQDAVFRLIVALQIAATATLWAGAGWLLLALAGAADVQAARAAAMIWALLFTAIWAGFLVAGNHFAYWFCHEDAQHRHYQMLLWGLGTMILLAVG